jgi:hypothetical protein
MHGFWGVIGNDVPEGSTFFAEICYEGRTSTLLWKNSFIYESGKNYETVKTNFKILI